MQTVIMCACVSKNSRVSSADQTSLDQVEGVSLGSISEVVVGNLVDVSTGLGKV